MWESQVRLRIDAWFACHYSTSAITYAYVGQPGSTLHFASAPLTVLVFSLALKPPDQAIIDPAERLVCCPARVSPACTESPAGSEAPPQAAAPQAAPGACADASAGQKPCSGVSATCQRDQTEPELAAQQRPMLAGMPANPAARTRKTPTVESATAAAMPHTLCDDGCDMHGSGSLLTVIPYVSSLSRSSSPHAAAHMSTHLSGGAGRLGSGCGRSGGAMRPGGTTSGWRRPGSIIGSEGGVNSGGLLMGPLGRSLGGCLHTRDGTCCLKCMRRLHRRAFTATALQNRTVSISRMSPVAELACEAVGTGWRY